MKGLCKYSGESPESAKIELLAVCQRLEQMGKLLDVMVKNVLTGICKCSHAEFKKIFEDVRSLRDQTWLGVSE